MSFELHGSIVTRSTRVPHPDDRIANWKRKRFVWSVNADVKIAIRDALERHRHLLRFPNIPLPELDGLLNFLAVPQEHRHADRRSILAFLLSFVGGLVVLVLAFFLVLLIAVAVNP